MADTWDDAFDEVAGTADTSTVPDFVDTSTVPDFAHGADADVQSDGEWDAAFDTSVPAPNGSDPSVDGADASGCGNSWDEAFESELPQQAEQADAARVFVPSLREEMDTDRKPKRGRPVGSSGSAAWRASLQHAVESNRPSDPADPRHVLDKAAYARECKRLKGLRLWQQKEQEEEMSGPDASTAAAGALMLRLSAGDSFPDASAVLAANSSFWDGWLHMCLEAGTQQQVVACQNGQGMC